METHPRYAADQILAEIKDLAARGQIRLSPRRFNSFKYFWMDFHWNVEFWIVILVSITSFVSSLAAASFPWGLLRLVVIIPLFFYLPGHTLLTILFSEKILTRLEQLLIEFATSVVLVLLVGLILNYSGLGFFASPSISMMILLDLVLGFAASYWNYSILRRSS
jgi:uncharacterized membrane protein